MADLFGVGFNQRNGRDAHPVSVVRQAKAQAEVYHVKQHDKDHRAQNRTLQRQAGTNTAADGQQGQPEHGVANTAKRRADGNFGALDAVHILLGALHRQNDADNKGHQERVGVKEAHMAFHRPRQVPLVGVDLFQRGQQPVQPAGGLHTFVVKRGLQQHGTPGHAVDILFRQLGTDVLVFVDVFIHAGQQRLFAFRHARQGGVVRCHLRIPLSERREPSVQVIYASGRSAPSPARPPQLPAPEA